MGIGHYADLEGELIEFINNLVVKQKNMDYSNMFACQFLNLRGSSFKHLEPSSLYSLIYVDISFTKIS